VRFFQNSINLFSQSWNPFSLRGRIASLGHPPGTPFAGWRMIVAFVYYYHTTATSIFLFSKLLFFVLCCGSHFLEAFFFRSLVLFFPTYSAGPSFHIHHSLTESLHGSLLDKNPISKTLSCWIEQHCSFFVFMLCAQKRKEKKKKKNLVPLVCLLLLKLRVRRRIMHNCICCIDKCIAFRTQFRSS
jgi:hypothetical protein